MFLRKYKIPLDVYSNNPISEKSYKYEDSCYITNIGELDLKQSDIDGLGGQYDWIDDDDSEYSEYFRTVTYLLTSILFGYLVWNSYDNTNFKKQLYNHEKYVIKTGTDKDTIIIDKKH